MNDSAPAPPGIGARYRARAAHAPAAVLFQHVVDARWQAVTAGEFMARAEACAAGLRAAGLLPGERLAILADNGLDWELIQCAALLAGITVVGIDPQETPARQGLMLATAGVVALAIDVPARWSQLPASAQLAMRTVLCFDPSAPPPDAAPPWWTPARLIALALPPLADTPPGTAEALVIFTSGSTGLPRAIVYRHGQLGRAVTALLAAFPQLQAGDRLVCWLPLANLFQRMINFCGVAAGACSWLLADPRDLRRALSVARPHWLVGVPRFYEKFYDGLLREIAAQPWPARLLARWALAVGARYRAVERAGGAPDGVQRFGHAVAEVLVLRRLRAPLGGAVRAALSGSAPCPPRVLAGLHACGVLVLEAYGLSENILPVAMNHPDDYAFGTVGRPLPGNEVELSAEGEILVRGPGVFGGYLHDATVPLALDARGFLHTGDLGVFTSHGRLQITGRVGEVFKSSTGRKIAPAPLEALLREVPGVGQAVVFGAGRKCVVALLTPPAEDEAALARPAAFTAWAMRASAAVPLVCVEQPPLLTPGAVLCDRRALSVANESLTVNLKLRRGALAARYGEALEALYAQLDGAPAAGTHVALGPDVLACFL